MPGKPARFLTLPLIWLGFVSIGCQKGMVPAPPDCPGDAIIKVNKEAKVNKEKVKLDKRCKDVAFWVADAEEPDKNLFIEFDTNQPFEGMTQHGNRWRVRCENADLLLRTHPRGRGRRGARKRQGIQVLAGPGEPSGPDGQERGRCLDRHPPLGDQELTIPGDPRDVSRHPGSYVRPAKSLWIQRLESWRLACSPRAVRRPGTRARVKKMYHVAVDRAAMREEILGPLFQRHVVSLSGTVDQRWLESFEAVQNDSDQFQRYRLDPQKGLVSFTCRASDGPKRRRRLPRAAGAHGRDDQPARDLRGRRARTARGAEPLRLAAPPDDPGIRGLPEAGPSAILNPTKRPMELVSVRIEESPHAVGRVRLVG